MLKIQKIGVLGAGIMGVGIARVAAAVKKKWCAPAIWVRKSGKGFFNYTQ